MILAFASAAHGANLLSKGVLMAVSAAAYGLTATLTDGWMAGIAAQVAVVAWWFALRGGKQARVELDRMDTLNSPHPTMMDVLKAHYFTGWLTCLSLYFFNYTRRPDLVNNGRFWDCRRPTECATGLTADLVMVVIMGAL